MLTIGHSTLPIDVFLHVLADNNVRVLVDIRTIPKSRHNPQFAQEALTAALRGVDFEYRWQRSLGGLRKALPDSANTGWRNTSFRGYADYMQTPEFEEAINELLTSSDATHTAIMCAEAVPFRCHRLLVADALAVRGIPVEHILYKKGGESSRQPHQITPFAHTSGGRLWYPPAENLFADLPPQPSST